MDARTTHLTSVVASNSPRLAMLKLLTQARLRDGKDDTLSEAFGLLAFADLNAVALEAASPAHVFGFDQYDVRYMRSLRDQVLGVGQAAKPLTKAQLRSMRTIMVRDEYTTQLALLTTT